MARTDAATTAATSTAHEKTGATAGTIVWIARAAMVAVAVAVSLAACRPVSVIPAGGDPLIPTPPSGEVGETVSIAYLKTLYNGAPRLITEEILIAGAVVSDDRQGNFYHTLVVADDTGGIEVRMDVEQIFKRYMIHTRATVRCNGLWLGSYGGTLSLGAEPLGDFQTSPLSAVETAEHVTSDNGFYGEVRPRVLTFNDLSLKYISTFVAFEGVRFADEERGLGWAETAVYSRGASGAERTADATGSGSDEGEEEGGEEVPSATDRHLVDAAGDTLVVRTSRHATFADWILPEGEGRIEGVLGYFNGTYQLVVCDSEKFSSTPAKTPYKVP